MMILRILILWTLVFCNGSLYAKTPLSMQSPNKKITARVDIEDGVVYYSVKAKAETVIERSVLGINVNNKIYGESAISLSLVKTGQINDRYTVRGKHATAVNNCEVYHILVNGATKSYRIEFRLFDDGCAFRYFFDNDKQMLITGEETIFKIPEQTRVWYFERDNDWKLKSYAGLWQSTTIDSLPVISAQGPIQGKPLIAEFKNGKYIVLTEAALYDYSGLRFKAIGNRCVQANFTEQNGFYVDKNSHTPWRVIIYGDNLQAIVNTDIITNLNPPPDQKLFASTDYIKPGRAVWSWLTQNGERGYMQPQSEMKFIDYAHQLNFEYTLIDEGWEKIWTNKWGQLNELCRYAAGKNVSIWVWKHSAEIRDTTVMYAFLDSIKSAGAVGVKTDFMNSEAKELIDFEIAFLKACAERQLMVNFHGCQAPTGESHTYPNEMTREGVRGLELNILNEMIPSWHNAALPFTRFLIGHGDYTPGYFSDKANTTYVHQLAMFYLLESPFQCMADDPAYLFNNEFLLPIVENLKKVPTTWDETVILPGSSIGKLAAMARRKGDTWYVAIINGTDAHQQFSLFPLFLDKDKSYNAILISDGEHDAVQKGNMLISSSDEYQYTLLPHGGLVIEIGSAFHGIIQNRLCADSVYALTKKVADWQVKVWQEKGIHRDLTNWTNAVCYTGYTAFNRIANDLEYLETMYSIGQRTNWKIGHRRTFADDYCVAQMYTELYADYKEPAMINDFRSLADSLLTLPLDESLEWKNNVHLRELAWCDALYMGPPAFALLSKAIGDKKYLDLADRLWWKTTDYLYDTEEHLFTRDSRYFSQRERNGEKIFWARGNGWVAAGLVRMLENMPVDYPARARYIRLYKDFIRRLVAIQHADGTWHTALLDPESYPSKESSGTALICYAITWGIKNGVLEKGEYYPAVKRAWGALADCVHPDGKLGHVQEVEEKPGNVHYESTDVYGVGAFLLAGTQLIELERMFLGIKERSK